VTSQILAAAEMDLRAFRRTPVVLALLVFLPVYFVGMFVLLVPERTVPLPIDGTTAQVGLSAFAATFMTALAVAILSGIVGLFLILTAETTDARLRLAGYSDAALVLARLLTLSLGVTVVTGISTAVAIQVFEPADLTAFVAVTGLLGVTYGVIGVIVGLLVDRLGGVYAMLFVPMIDVLLFQNPLATASPAWAAYLPGHFGTKLLFEAAFTPGLGADNVAYAVGYAGLLVVASIGIFYRSTTV